TVHIAVRSRRPRGRLSGVEIDPTVVRQARLAAGMSLAEVAGSELTRQAVHLIETGKARPSMRSLRILSERLGMPASSFLARPENGPANPEVAELDHLCQRQEYHAVVERARQILQRCGSVRM